jgi:hypothetical protein
VLRTLQAKLEDLTTCQDLIVKHGASLQKTLADLESAQNYADPAAKIKPANERATLFRITTNAMINACNEFVALAQSHGGKWLRMLKHERDQRLRLEETLEQLARQHATLERAALSEARDHGIAVNPSVFSSDDEGEFQDALEDPHETGEAGSAGRKRFHKRSGSEVSEGGIVDREDSDEKSGRAGGNGSGTSGVGGVGTGGGSGGGPETTNLLAAAKIITRDAAPSSSTPKPAEERPSFLDPNGSRSAVQGVPGKTGRVRRARIPPRPNASVSLWSIMKNCIGKELSKIPMPVNFNEPISFLQRLTEDLEYSHLLDSAAECADSGEQMAYVAAFTISAYSTTTTRTGKPFNPLLGETFECDRTDDMGWRSICEQVSHHPPAAAQYATGKGWKLWQEFTMSSKFRGKYLQIVPLGIAHLEFESSGHHYTWRKVTTTVHNIIVGRLWIDNYGEMGIENHKTGDKCHLKYIPYSYFSRETPRKVTGFVSDQSGTVRWVVQATWDEHAEIAKVISQSSADRSSNGKPVFETLNPLMIWKRNPPLPSCEEFYNYTKLAVELNEPEPGVAPSDSRLRPDQRRMEEGDFDAANSEKQRLEEKQRTARRQREAETEQAIQEGRPYKAYEPVWFSKQKDQWTGNLIHMYTGQYWDSKTKRDWARCPDIF